MPADLFRKYLHEVADWIADYREKIADRRIATNEKPGSVLEQLKAGKMPIYEPGLEEIVRRNRQEGRLEFTTNLPKAVRDSQIVFIASCSSPKTPVAASSSAFKTGLDSNISMALLM